MGPNTLSEDERRELVKSSASHDQQWLAVLEERLAEHQKVVDDWAASETELAPDDMVKASAKIEEVNWMIAHTKFRLKSRMNYGGQLPPNAVM